MNSQELFLRGLDTIRQAAAAGGGAVSVAEILGAFPKAPLSEEQIEKIYDYLDREGITLKDYVPHDTRSLELGETEAEALTEEEQKVLDFYLEDLEGVVPLSAAETEELAEHA